MEIVSDDEEDEEEEDVLSAAAAAASLPDDKYRAQSLEKMIALVAMLTEKSRGEDNQLSLSNKDFNVIVAGKVRKTTS